MGRADTILANWSTFIQKRGEQREQEGAEKQTAPRTPAPAFNIKPVSRLFPDQVRSRTLQPYYGDSPGVGRGCGFDL